MDGKILESLRQSLLDRRDALWREVASEEERLAVIAEDRESELVERAQEEVAARILDRLDERGKREIEAIDAALRRIREGKYGKCSDCGKSISVGRLRALPETLSCADCSSDLERGRRVEGESSAPTAIQESDFHESEDRLTDQEVTSLLLDRLSEDDRLDVDELDVECRAGVIHLSGTLPNESQHELLRQEINEMLGSCEVDDRIEIGGVRWEEQSSPPGEIAEDEEPGEPEGRDRKR